MQTWRKVELHFSHFIFSSSATGEGWGGGERNLFSSFASTSYVQRKEGLPADWVVSFPPPLTHAHDVHLLFLFRLSFSLGGVLFGEQLLQHHGIHLVVALYLSPVLSLQVQHQAHVESEGRSTQGAMQPTGGVEERKKLSSQCYILACNTP